MKAQHTIDRKDSFLDWRTSQVDKFGTFLWPQINYEFETANIISAVFEQQGNLNSEIPVALQSASIKNYLVNFVNPDSSKYIRSSELADTLHLHLASSLPDDWKGKTYWQYRLATRPQNCLTTDVDSLEIKKDGSFVAIEAAQLYDTTSIDVAIRHIFRTFKFRPNQVNPKQYLAQYKYVIAIGGESFILFHQIIQGKIDAISPVFLLKNDEMFFKMLSSIINRYNRYEEDLFVRDYSEYLQHSLKQHKNIESAYLWLLA